MLEVTIGVEMETDEDSHYLAVRHLAFTSAMLLSVGGKRDFYNLMIIFLAKIILFLL